MTWQFTADSSLQVLYLGLAKVSLVKEQHFAYIREISKAVIIPLRVNVSTLSWQCI